MNEALSDRLQCVCSTVGFERKQWSGHYYPAVCPLDWRVAYFMNDSRRQGANGGHLFLLKLLLSGGL